MASRGDDLDPNDEGSILVQNFPTPLIQNFAGPDYQSNAMMRSTDSVLTFKSSSSVSMRSLPDVTATKGYTSPALSCANSTPMSVLLMDSNENLKLDNESKFKKRTDIQGCVYVVSVFGNTGEGKSHLLNHTFFKGKEVFRTFEETDGTEGVWVAFRSEKNLVIVDTEGLLNPRCSSPERQTRMLYKILAVSDVVIFHSRAERLPSNLFTFLGDASKAYSILHQFEPNSPRARVGPFVIINHQPTHVKPLSQVCSSHGPEMDLKEKFQSFDRDLKSFSSLKYIGSQGSQVSPDLLDYIIKKLEDNVSTRPRRNPEVVFRTLQRLNERFKTEITPHSKHFPDEYLICEARCESCDARCSLIVGHGRSHNCSEACKFKPQFENQIYRCRRCDQNGRITEVVPKACSGNDSTLVGLTKYLWSGYVLECPSCGIIYRSRNYWYGNPDPDDSAVITEIKHVWPGPSTVLQGTHNAARKVVDGVSFLSETISSVSSGATSALSQWVADYINPDYWVPNSEIKNCKGCGKAFEGVGPNIAKGGKHHCRSCGEGFCADCSNRKRQVPERGWGTEEVRVCEDCYTKRVQGSKILESDVNVRKKLETVTSTVGTITSVLDFPIEYLKDSTRPVYWVPDADITDCFCCQEKFTERRPLHHCRQCGQGVCEECSMNRRPVPSRGWDAAVRVCNKCVDASP